MSHNATKWDEKFAIDYKGTLCSDNMTDVDNDLYKRDCPFPTLNKGWVIQSDYVKGDCSLQYVDLYGSSYTTKCLIYSVAAGIPFCLSCYYLNIVHKSRVSKGAAKPNLMEKMFSLNVLFSLCLLISGLDIDMVGGIIGVLPRAALVGFGIACVMSVMFMLVSTWITILNTKGKTATTPGWLKVAVKVSTFIAFLGEAVFGCVEYIPGLQPANAQINSYGTYSGTCNSIKNGILGFLIMFWMFIGINTGLGVNKKLAAGSGGGPTTKEAKKIGRMCMAMAIGCGIGSIYKFLFIPFRMGKTVVMDYPCSESPGMVSLVGMILTIICWVIVFAQKPGGAKKVEPKKDGTASTKTQVSSSTMSSP